MSKDVNEMIGDIIRREGGFVNHPADRGKATKYGITLETLSKWRGRPTGIENVKRLTKTEAADIYRAEYFDRPNINLLPEQLQPVVFDMAVNMGPKQAIKIMQRSLTQIGIETGVDGIIGPQTLKATAESASLFGPLVIYIMIGERIKFYRDIVKRNPSQVVFLKGWENRAMEFIA
jgi:lysozyme family protein